MSSVSWDDKAGELMKTSTCCICGRSVDHTSGDRLELHWYEPGRWWVLTHIKNGKQWCAQSNYHLFYGRRHTGIEG